MKTAKDITLQEFLDNLDFVDIDRETGKTLLMSDHINITIPESTKHPEYVLCYDRREYLKSELAKIQKCVNEASFSSTDFGVEGLYSQMYKIRDLISNYLEDLDNYDNQ